MAVAQQWFNGIDHTRTSYFVVRETVPAMKTNMENFISIHNLTPLETVNLGLLSVRNFMINEKPNLLNLEFHIKTKRYDKPEECKKMSIAGLSSPAVKRTSNDPDVREKKSRAAQSRHFKTRLQKDVTVENKTNTDGGGDFSAELSGWSTVSEMWA